MQLNGMVNCYCAIAHVPCALHKCAWVSVWLCVCTGIGALPGTLYTRKKTRAYIYAIRYV